MTVPPAMPFDGVDEQWALSVARHVLWSADVLPDPDLSIDECWLTDEFALYLRHRRGGTHLGVRMGRLGVNPTTETPPVDSGQEGAYLFHTLYDTPPQREWTDPLGYEWWGDPPGGPWRGAVEGPRVRTLVGPADGA